MTVGRKGRVTLEEAAVAARNLHVFTRNDLAEELGIKPIAVSRFLGELVERELITVGQVGDAGVEYHAELDALGGDTFMREMPPAETIAAVAEPEPEPDAKEPEEESERSPLSYARNEGRVTAEEVRDWAIMLGRFTTNQLATEMEVGWATARKYLDRLIEQGIIVRVQDARGPRDAMLFELRGEVPEPKLKRERQAPPELEVLQKWAGGAPERAQPIPGTGTGPKVSNNKDVNLLVAAAQAFGWTIENRARHAVVVIPGAERPIPIPGTPKGPGMVRAFRDQLRAAGLPDIGYANEQPERPSEHKDAAGGERAAKRGKTKEKLGSVAGYRRPGRRGKKAA